MKSLQLMNNLNPSNRHFWLTGALIGICGRQSLQSYPSWWRYKAKELKQCSKTQLTIPWWTSVCRLQRGQILKQMKKLCHHTQKLDAPGVKVHAHYEPVMMYSTLNACFTSEKGGKPKTFLRDVPKTVVKARDRSGHTQGWRPLALALSVRRDLDPKMTWQAKTLLNQLSLYMWQFSCLVLQCDSVPLPRENYLQSCQMTGLCFNKTQSGDTSAMSNTSTTKRETDNETLVTMLDLEDLADDIFGTM